MENTNLTFHSYKLSREFEDRRSRNPNYSLRSFARFLEIDPSVLSAVLKGKRKIPKKNIDFIIEKLNFSPSERERFASCTKKQDASEGQNQAYCLEDNERNFKIISEWEYYAFLTLLDTETFLLDTQWIAEKLQVSEARVKFIIADLEDSKLISINNGHIEKGFNQLTTTDGSISAALRKSHKENLNLALEKIDKVPLNERCYGSTTIAVDPNKIEEARALIKDFRQRLSDLMKDGNPTEVYLFSSQLFPLSNTNLNHK